MSIFKSDILAGRVAVVTGGGSGICKGIAAGYAAHGADLVITSRKQERLDAAADELRGAGGEVLGVAADVRKPEEVAAVIEQTLDKFGRIDVLVNGAAGNFLAPVAALSEKGFRTVIEIDLQGTFNVSKAAFEALQKSEAPSILNISATLQYHGTPMQAHAAAAKAGVDSLTRTLAVEWAPLGIRVNAIAPGPIGDTEGMSRLAPGDIKERITQNIPLQRFGTIQEVADLAVYLATPSAAYITGAIYVIDGGACITPPRVFAPGPINWAGESGA